MINLNAARLACRQLGVKDADFYQALSEYPLWQSSDGWQRINWAKALCARVTLDKHGDVAKVETADQVALTGPSVVNAQYTDAGNHPASDSSAGEKAG